jgi:hypothetical protein
MAEGEARGSATRSAAAAEPKTAGRTAVSVAAHEAGAET